MKIYIALLVAILLAGNPGQAKAQSMLVATPSSGNGHDTEYQLAPDLYSMSIGDSVSLPDLNGTPYRAVLDRLDSDAPGGQRWVGHIEGQNELFRVILTRGAQSAFGTITTPNGSWSLAPLRPGGPLVLQPATAPPLEPGSDAIIPLPYTIARAASALGPGTTSQIETAVETGSLGTIDIAVIYTEGLRIYYGLGVITRVQHLVNVLDQALIDSDTGLRARLVNASLMPVPWIETTSTIESVDDLIAGASFGNPGTSADVFGQCETGFGLQCNNDGDLSSLYALRNGAAADVVVLLRRYWRAQQVYCGVAYVPGNGEGIIVPADDHIYGVAVVGDGPDANGTGASCGDLTFSHEVGHNLGSTHNIENTSAPGVLDYSYGHRYDCSLRTIMAYDSLRSNLTCPTNSPVTGPNETWVPAFSNPAVDICLGLPCGSGPGGWNFPGSNSDDTTTLTDNARSMREQGHQVQHYRAPEAPLVRSAILPYSRTVPAGQTATAFVTIANPASSGGVATGCELVLHGANSAQFSYQTTDPASNGLTGAANTPADIAAGGTQSFLIAVALPVSIFATDLRIDARCENRRTAPVITGVNTFRHLSTNQALPDMIALSATVSGNGFLELPGANGAAAFSVASVNLATSATIVVQPRLAAGMAPFELLEICRTNAQTGSCETARASSVTITASANETQTFSVFVRAGNTVPSDPASNRIFVDFLTVANVAIGGTSVAVRTGP